MFFLVFLQLDKMTNIRVFCFFNISNYVVYIKDHHMILFVEGGEGLHIANEF
jgi:hypothetical protein